MFLFFAAFLVSKVVSNLKIMTWKNGESLQTFFFPPQGEMKVKGQVVFMKINSETQTERMSVGVYVCALFMKNLN